MKTYNIKINNVNFEILQDDDGKFIKPNKIKELEKWGTAMKPSYEPIICARKPNNGTYANNALKWGVSGLNIDGGRIGTKDTRQKTGGAIKGSGCGTKKGAIAGSSLGRFPSNIIISEDVAPLIDEQSDNASRFFKNIPLDSRIAYIPKASKSERNAGCEELEEKQKVFNGQSNKSSKELKDVEERFTTKPAANFHPTVKPLKLMEYLCTLTKTPTGGIVLDPFAGSGTTGVACINTDRDFILIEKEEEYIEIIKARIDFALKKRTINYLNKRLR